MKGLRYSGLAVLVLLLAFGCSGPQRTGTQGVDYNVYFLESNLSAVPGGDALRPVAVAMEADSSTAPREIAGTLVETLLAGPADESLQSPIPSGTSLLSLEIQGSQAVVDLSTPYRSLSGVALTLADYAITLTLTQLPEISSVAITVRGQELTYRDSQIFTAQEALFSSNEDVIGTLPVTLYFPDENGVLSPLKQTLDLYEGDTQVNAVIRALLNGPDMKEGLMPLSEHFQVKSAWLEDDICYVNLSSALSSDLEVSERRTALAALTQSLCSLDSVAEVQFLVDGVYSK